MGKIAIEALVISIGISIGTAQIEPATEEDRERESERGARPKDLLGVISLSACGAVVLATNIAITDEVVILGLESDHWHLVGMVVVSLLLCALIMVFSDLLETQKGPGRTTGMKIALGTVLSYSVAFFASATILYLFGRFDGVALPGCLGMIVVLAVAASMGAAAGKILIR